MRGGQTYDLTEATPGYQAALNALEEFMQARPFGIGPTNLELLAEAWGQMREAAAAGEPGEEIDRIRTSDRYAQTFKNRDELIAACQRQRDNSLKPTDHKLYTDKSKPMDAWARLLDDRNLDRTHATTIEEKMKVEQSYQDLAVQELAEAERERKQQAVREQLIRDQRDRGVFGEDAEIVEVDGKRVIRGNRRELTTEEIESALAASRRGEAEYVPIDDPEFTEEFQTAEDEDAIREEFEKSLKQDREGHYESGD